MKRLYWILMALFNPVNSDELMRMGGWGEYLAHHGVENEIDDEVHMIEGEAVIKLDKHLKHI